jgi:hypothetical protein
MLPSSTPDSRTPATGVSPTIIKQDHEKCETRAGSATSPTTSPDPYSKQAASGPSYTPDCEEPLETTVARAVPTATSRPVSSSYFPVVLKLRLERKAVGSAVPFRSDVCLAKLVCQFDLIQETSRCRTSMSSVLY